MAPKATPRLVRSTARRVSRGHGRPAGASPQSVIGSDPLTHLQWGRRCGRVHSRPFSRVSASLAVPVTLAGTLALWAGLTVGWMLWGL